MTSTKLQTRSASLCRALLGVGLTAFALTACGKAPDQGSVAPAAEVTGASTATAQAMSPPASLVVAAPTDVRSPPAGTVVPPNPNAAADAIADNAKVAELAKQFEADPAAIARQNAACGPADQVLNSVYAQSGGAVTDELRRFRVACMAKDAAQQELARRPASAGGGVKNTGSL